MSLRIYLSLMLSLGIASLVTGQKIKVYRDDMGVTNRFADTNVKSIKSGDYDSFSFQCPAFFDTISAMCKRLEVVSDSVVFKKDPLYREMVKILFEGKKNRLVIYNDFFSYNGKFYQINCELFEFYIQFFTVSRAVLSVPGCLFSQNCESALKIRFSIKPKMQ